MTAPTSNEFLLRFPEFGDQAGSVVSGALAEAAASTPETVWGARHTEAVSYLTAHLLATRIIQIGQQVGTLSGNAQGDLLQSTLYGQEYIRLLNSLPLTGFVA